MQQCIGQGQWQDEALLQRHWRLVDETLGEADGVIIVDSSEFPQHSEPSVGPITPAWATVDANHAGIIPLAIPGWSLAHSIRSYARCWGQATRQFSWSLKAEVWYVPDKANRGGRYEHRRSLDLRQSIRDRGR
jgi:hypothetical protein